MQDFVHLHVHTYYSILDGQSPVGKLVDKAVADGMKGMAITDHGNMFAIKEFFDYAGKVNKTRKKEGLEPFKPIFGCEMYVARRRKEDKENEKGDRGGNHLIVLAKNFQGYHNLIKLVSRAWTDGFYGRPRTDKADLEKYHEGLIVCSACIAGEVPEKIIKRDMKGAREAIEWYKRVFGDDYYLELQRHEVKSVKQRANRDTFPLQQLANGFLIDLAKEYNIKLICTNDCHFVDEENAEAHDHLLCLSTGKDLDDPNRLLYTKQEWFKSRAEMNEVFSDIPEALSNTLEILDKVEMYDIESDAIMPNFPIPADFGTEEQWRKKYTEEQLFKEFTSDENGENSLPQEEAEAKIHKLGGYEKLYRIKFEADYLAKLAYDGAKAIYGDPLPQEVDDRIRFELHIMKTMGFPGYFLIVQDFINAARSELNVWVGPGRGSAAGSVVAYCLGITRLDPLKYDLLFERFLNPDRVSLPDIDTDFDDDGRGKVLQWVMEKYGQENCAHIITYATMATKNSIKDVARVEKLPLDRSNALCKAIPDRLPDGLKMNLENAIKCTPELKAAETSDDERERNTIKYARMLEGTVRGTGIHACGFIICRDPISDHVPVSTADDPDFPDTKTTVTQYDGHVIESTGLIKMDFLGLKTLSEMKEACRIIKESKGVEIDLDNLPLDDELTYKLYQEGRTVGTFQFESPGMQKYLKELHPTVFEDLIAMNALYRPGPMDYIPSFINRKNGREQIHYDIPVMEKYLKDTYGITVYQEQVMLLSRLLADFTRGESDALRKAMGKKKKDIVDAMKPKFIEGGKKNGHDPEILEKIWSDWEKFASYAFNKSHAACYSWVAYQTAYLKAHYPSEFMAAIMTRRKNDIKEITKLMDECRSMGIATLLPDVNESYADFGVNAKGEIRFGLAAIKGMGISAAQSIIEERKKNGPYTDIYNFAERLNYSQFNKKCFESLALSGALDCFTELAREQYFLEPETSKQTFIDQLMSYGQAVQRENNSQSLSLFGGMDDFQMISKPPIPPYNFELNDTERLNREKELIGIYLSAHPLDEYYVIMNKVCSLKCAAIKDIATLNVKNVTFGGIVKGIRTGMTKKNKPYGNVAIEDYSGEGELRMFGDSWTKYQNYFKEGAALYIHAAIESPPWNPDRKDLNISQIQYLSDIKDDLVQKLTIAFSMDALDMERSSELLLFCEEEGTTELYLKPFYPKYKTSLSLKAQRKINVNKALLEMLDSWPDATYKIN
ncbi:MAG: DNA polymerase III subunit alpha [Bacteroidaceae bacterium]|nr:DNA polymerase III subunit alpha [Bacteroidaceae bacterium]